MTAIAQADPVREAAQALCANLHDDRKGDWREKLAALETALAEVAFHAAPLAVTLPAAHASALKSQPAS